MTSLAKALEMIQSKTGATAEQSAEYLAQAANERVPVKLLEADSNEREDYPLSPIPFPDLRGRYRAIKKIADDTLWDIRGRMPGNDVNAAVHGANHYAKLFEYAVGLFEENAQLKKRISELEEELED